MARRLRVRGNVSASGVDITRLNTLEDLRAWGYEPIAVELDEFLKAGGSAKCLTLRLDGEEAAAWKARAT